MKKPSIVVPPKACGDCRDCSNHCRKSALIPLDEASSDWTMNSLFGSSGTHDYASDQKYYGAKSLKLTKTNTAGYERASQSMALEKGKTYTLSGYIKTSDVTGSASGAYLRVLYNTASGQTSVNSPVLKGTNDWDRYSVMFTIPADSSSEYASVYLT